jgi:hypothetical protein
MPRSFALVAAALVFVPARVFAQESPTEPPQEQPSPTTQPPPPPPAPQPPAGTAQPSIAPPNGAAAKPAAAPAPAPAPADDDEGVMTIKASRKMDMQKFAETSQEELKIAGGRTRYALNLFGDVQLGAASRSEGSLRSPDPAFAVGVFDMLFTANLENGLSMTSEFSAQYEPNAPLAELERLHLRWRPSKYFFVEAGRFHTDIGYWNVAYHHGRYLQLSVDRPRTILLHGGLLPVHWIGVQAGTSIGVGPGSINLVVSGGTAREKIGTVGHGLHGSAFTSVNAVHAKLDFSGFLHRDLHFGVSAVYDRIPEEAAFTRPGLPDQSIDEKIGNAYIALPSLPVIFIAEAYGIEHTLNSSAKSENIGSKWRTFGAFAMLGYQIGRVTPYIRGEYIGSQVGAYIFDPYYVPEPKSHAGFTVSMDAKEGVVGTRVDLSDWCSLKLEYQVMGGVGTRLADQPTPVIHTGIASWSFGI